MSARPSGALPSQDSTSKQPIPEEDQALTDPDQDGPDLARDQDQGLGSTAASRPRSGASAAAGGVAAAARTEEGAAWDDEDAGIMQDEAGDEVGVLGDGLGSAMDPDEDEEVRRQMFPAEVVQALDDENDAALAEIRQEWQKLVKDSDALNRHKLAVIDRWGRGGGRGKGGERRRGMRVRWAQAGGH